MTTQAPDLPLSQLDDLSARATRIDDSLAELDAATGSGHRAPRPLVLSGLDPQGQIDDLEFWLAKIRGERTDNTRTPLRRTVKPESIDAVMADDLVQAAFQEEAAMIHAAGQRVHGFAFEAAWCSALRRAGFNATLCRAASQADVAIAFEEPPPPDNVLGVQLKSNERHLKAQMRGKDYPDAAKDHFSIRHYASVESLLSEFAAHMHREDPDWAFTGAFHRTDDAGRGQVSAAAAYATARHMQGYDAIVYCETSFTDDVLHEHIAFRLSSVDTRRMRGALAAAMGWDLPEAAAQDGVTVRARPTRREGRTTSWAVECRDGDQVLFRARIYEGGTINVENIDRTGDLVCEHQTIVTPATSEIGINDATDVPPPIIGRPIDPLSPRAREMMGMPIESDAGADVAHSVRDDGMDLL